MSIILQSEQHRIAWSLVQQVVERALPGETGSQRLQQVGALLTILAYQDGPDPLTSQRFAEIFGMAPPQTSKLVKLLVARGLVEREQVPQPTGRGVMYILRVSETEAMKKLKEELLSHAAAMLCEPLKPPRTR